MKCKHLIFLVVSILFSNMVFSQTGNVRGFVYDEKDGEPVMFINVFLEGTQMGSPTDKNGSYFISDIPVGDYVLVAGGVKYDSVKQKITVKEGKIENIKITLKLGDHVLKGVNIVGDKIDRKNDPGVSVLSITPDKIFKVPAIGGTADFAQYLQVVPGVVFTGDQGGQLYIRGGSPVQNKVILDGAVIYNPFHSIGLFSVFETEIMKSADVYTGGFGAEYGGRISSIMDIRTRDGNKKELSGVIAASPFGANLVLEGPLMKQTKDRENSLTFVLSAKNSYLEQTSKVLYKYADEDGLPFNFMDLYSKVSFNTDNGSKINVFGFNFNDDVQYRSITNYNWNTHGGGANFVLVPGASTMLIEGNFAYSYYEISMDEEASIPRTSSVGGFNGGLDFTYFAKNSEFKYGMELLGFSTDFHFFNEVGVKIEQEENTTEAGFYLKYKAKWFEGKLLFEPSIRLQWYPSLSEMSPEPRLAIKYNVNSNFRIKFAGGLYSQNLISATSDRDVVNLFYGFVSGPDNIPSTFQGEEITSKLQKAQHLILGVEFDPSKRITVNIEGYFKNFSQLTNLNRDKIYDDEDPYLSKPEYLRKDFIIETAVAYGADVSVNYDYKRWYFWGVYTLGWITKEDENTIYVPHYDRRHNINLVASYKFGKSQNWEVSARWNYGSGFPFTRTQGFYEQLDFGDGIYTDYTTANGELGIQYDDLNTGRLPAYHRLDCDIKYTASFLNDMSLELSAGVTNAYNRKNVFYVNRVTSEVVYQLPILPTIGIVFKF